MKSIYCPYCHRFGGHHQNCPEAEPERETDGETLSEEELAELPWPEEEGVQNGGEV